MTTEQDLILECACELKIRKLSWKHPRVLIWIQKRGEQRNRNYKSPYDLELVDFEALYQAIIKTPVISR